VLGHQLAGDGQVEEIAHALHRRVVLEGGEIADLGVAEDLQAVLVDVLGETGEGEPRLLDARADHAAVEAAFAGEQLEAEVEIPVVEQLADLDGVHSRPRVTSLLKRREGATSSLKSEVGGLSTWRLPRRSADRWPRRPGRRGWPGAAAAA